MLLAARSAPVAAGAFAASLLAYAVLLPLAPAYGALADAASLVLALAPLALAAGAAELTFERAPRATSAVATFGSLAALAPKRCCSTWNSRRCLTRHSLRNPIPRRRVRRKVQGPDGYAAHLTKERYHPRSSKHGDCLSQLVLRDLLDHCPELRQGAISGRIAFSLNYPVQVADATLAAELSAEAREELAWTIDLVLGPPKTLPKGHIVRKPKHLLLEPTSIRYAPVAEVWMMLDAKGVMTEHGKARRNRQRDLTALWAVMHTFYPSAVVGAVVPVNIARQFKSPLRTEVSLHSDVKRVVDETLRIFRAVRRAPPSIGGAGLEALGCFVVDFDNIGASKARILREPPAPPADDRISYERLIHDLCTALLTRFGKRLSDS